jgi:hypothetical protein
VRDRPADPRVAVSWLHRTRGRPDRPRAGLLRHGLSPLAPGRGQDHQTCEPTRTPATGVPRRRGRSKRPRLRGVSQSRYDRSHDRVNGVDTLSRPPAGAQYSRAGPPVCPRGRIRGQPQIRPFPSQGAGGPRSAASRDEPLRAARRSRRRGGRSPPGFRPWTPGARPRPSPGRA